MSNTGLPLNGLIDRRRLLAAGTSLATVGLVKAAAPEPWMREPGTGFTNYGAPAEAERDVVRWISANPQVPGNGVAWCPLHELDGTITPNGLHFERHHNGVPRIDPSRHELVVQGLVDRPLAFSIDALLRYPRRSTLCALECGGNSNAGWRRRPIQTPPGYFHGLVSCSEWSGVPLRIILEEAGLRPDARWAVAEGADAFAMTVSVPVEKLLDDALLALYQNGERMRPSQGYPLRLLVPGWEGVLSVKWLRTLKLTAEPVMARNETAKYTELQPSGRARMFTYEMDVKSLITAPAFGVRLPAPGFYEITGLAWSGRGTISRVEVSADGGMTWADAQLNPPVLPRAFTRFRIPWEWRGQPAVLQSRAWDDSGAIQPSRADLVARRGRHGYFHYNAIVSWAVAPDGRLSHVYVDDGDDERTPPADPFDAPWDF